MDHNTPLLKKKERNKLNPSPVKTANTFSKIFFIWVWKLLIKGNKTTLNPNDVYSVLEGDKSQLFSQKLLNNLGLDKKTNKKLNKSLLMAIAQTFGTKFIILGIVYFIKECIFRLGQALCLGLFLRYYGSSSSGSIDIRAYYYAGLFLLTNMIYTILTHPWEFYSQHLGFQISTSLAGILYQKVTNTNAPMRSISSQDTNLQNMLTNDLKRFEQSIGYIHALWTAPILVILVLFTLWTMFGWRAISGFVLILILLPVLSGFSKLISKLRGMIASRTDKRLDLLNQVLKGINIMKTFTMENYFFQQLNQARAKEVKMILIRLAIQGFCITLFTLSSKIMLLTTILVLVFTSNTTLDAEMIFVTMTLYNVSSLIISGTFPLGLTMISEIGVTTKRLQLFLEAESRNSGVIHVKDIPDGIGIVRVDNYTGAWKNEPALHNINFESIPGKLNVIMGPIGGGKTSFLLALLGELKRLNGTIVTRGKISFAPQGGWVFPGTVQENIICGNPLNQQWYLEVLRSCALLDDLANFRDGDKTIVGEHGSNLSGGQKSRISLARAIYAKSDLYLLDDPFSAVDNKVGTHIFKNVIQGILKNKTVILVTHQIKFVMPHDNLTILKDGKVLGSATASEIFKKYPELEAEVESKPEAQQEKETQTSSKVVEWTNYSEGQSLSMSILRRTSFDYRTISSVSISTEDYFLHPNNTYEVQEEQKEGRVGLKYCYDFMRIGNGLWALVFLIFLGIIGQFFMSGSDYWLQYWISAEESAHLNSTDRTIYYETYIGSFVLLFLTNVSCFILLFYECISSSALLHYKGISRLLYSPLNFFSFTPTGQILNRFSKDLGAVDEYLPLAVYNTFVTVIEVAGMLILIIVLNPFISIPSVILLISYYYIRKFYLNSSTDIKRIEAISRSPVYSLFSTSLDGGVTIRAFGLQNYFIRKFQDIKDKHTSAYYLYISLSGWLVTTLDWMSILYQFSVFLCFFLFTKDPAAAGLAISSIVTITIIFSAGIQASTELENELVSVERLEEYGKLEVEQDYNVYGDDEKSAYWPKSAFIQLNNVVVKYGNSIVLNGISCKIYPKEKIGIIGRTGAGKSTFISSLLRFVELTSGSISIDGLDIKNIGLKLLRSKISLIPQQPILFNTTLRQNLDPSTKFTDNEIWKVLKETQLTKLIDQKLLGNCGLETEIHNSGNDFSHGERQLIFIARAILNKTKIVLLDEATANVDNETDKLIQNLVRKEFKDCTVITVAHRIQTVLDNDRICVLEDGRILEFESPDILLAQPKSYLFRLVNG